MISAFLILLYLKNKNIDACNEQKIGHIKFCILFFNIQILDIYS